MIVLLPVSALDWEILLKLRNDPDVIASSRNRRPVMESEHRTWMLKMLARGDRRLYLLREGAEVIGAGRLEAHRDGTEVHLMLHSHHRGQGKGREAIEALLAKVRELNWPPAYAYVRATNPASYISFVRAGFLPQGEMILLFRVQGPPLVAEAP